MSKLVYIFIMLQGSSYKTDQYWDISVVWKSFKIRAKHLASRQTKEPPDGAACAQQKGMSSEQYKNSIKALLYSPEYQQFAV